MSVSAKDFYVFGPFRLDAVGCVLFDGDRIVALPPKQIATLIVLVKARGAVVDRDTLVSQVWPDTFVEEAGLTRNISQLRKVIEAGGATFIETIPKRGYRFVAPVAIERVEPDTVRLIERVTRIQIDEAFEADDDPARSERRLPAAPAAPPLRRTAIAVVLAVIVIAAAILAWRQSIATSPLLAPESIRTLAILPFRHLNPTDADRYLSVGLADALITRFANLASLTITPTATSIAYGGQSPIDAGRALGVDAVLDGSIQRSTERTRVTVQLIAVRSGRPLWAGSFDENDTEILSIQDSVSTSIAGLLVPNLGNSERERLARRATNSHLAWSAYMRGRALWAARGPRQLDDSVAAFRSAIDADPAFALAYTGLAQSLMAQSSYQYRWAHEVQPRAKEAALQALALDPLLGDAHGVLGGIAFTFDWDWRSAERELTRGLALNPNESSLHQMLSNLLMSRGRLHDSIVAAEAAVRLDPQGFAPNSNLTLMLNWARRYDESIAQGRKTMTLPGIPAFPALMNSATYLLLGRRAEAQSAYEDARRMIGPIPIVIATEARLAAVDGQPARARALLTLLEQDWEKRVVEPVFIAAPYVNAGDHDRALYWLDHAASRRSAYAPYMAIDPSFDALRTDARFVDLMKVVGLADVVDQQGRTR